MYCIDISLTRILGIHQNGIEIYHNKDIKLLSKDYIHIALQSGQCIRKTKKHDLILKVATYGGKNRYLFITFSYLHPMIYNSHIKLYELLSQTQLIQNFANEKQGLSALIVQIIEVSIINTYAKPIILFFVQLYRSTYS